MFVKLTISQTFGFAAENWVSTFETVAKNKVGFTEFGPDEAGQIEFVGGQQGVAERNIVRYLLEIDVFLKTRAVPGEKLFNKRAELRLDETER